MALDLKLYYQIFKIIIIIILIAALSQKNT